MTDRRLLIVYATVHGQAALVARRFADVASSHGLTPVLRDVRRVTADDLAACRFVVIAASVHFGRHSRRIVRFVRANRARLAAMHSAFVSVSGSAGDPAGLAEAESYVDGFVKATGWSPAQRLLAAGAIRFSKYNPIIRFITKRSLAAQGKVIDPSRDYEFTDWDAVTRFAASFVASCTSVDHAPSRAAAG